MMKKRVRMVFVSCMVMLGVASAAMAETECNLLPNGSFEFWGHFAKEVLPYLKDKEKTSQTGMPLVIFDSDDPLVPVRWNWWYGADAKPFSIKQSTDAHSGKYALQLKGPGGQFNLASLEVNPRSTYSYGVWVKGTGDVSVGIAGIVPEGTQVLSTAKDKATGEWQKICGTLTVPGHIRMVSLSINISGGGDLLIDDAFISAPLDFNYNAYDVLTKKAERDSNTILFADFDKDDPGIKLIGKAHLVDGGRFGRALRVDKPDMAVIPFHLTKMPEEGTLECWISPDSVPQLAGGKGDLFMDVRSSGQSLGNFGAGTDVTLHWVWRISGDLYGQWNYLGTSGTISLQRMRKGQWTHLAVTWDPAAWRIYVDGVLAGMLTKPPLGWWDTPVNITIGSEYGHACWSGMIDEIRVSKVKRFGPFVPKGSTPVPLPVPAQEPQTAKTPAAPAKPAVDVPAERKKMIGTVPPTRSGEFEAVPTPEGDYVYEATSAKPMIDGGELTIDKDWHVKGLTSVYAPGTRTKSGLADYGGAYWTLGGIKPGSFWIGLLYESQEGNREAPSWSPSMYLNGRVIQCSTLGNPVQIAPGIWLAELQSADAEQLKPGDDIAVTSIDRRKSRFVRLLLHQKEPARGAFRTAMNFGGHWWSPYSTLGVSAEARFVGKDGKNVVFAGEWRGMEQLTGSPGDIQHATDGSAIVRCRLSNPLPVAITVDYTCEVKGYYRQMAGRDTAQLILPPHTSIFREVRFAVTPDDPSYSVETKIAAVKPPDLGWPEADTVAFFPGYRQSVPWTDPFSYRDMRRLVFSKPVADFRQTESLNGTWEIAYSTALKQPMPPPTDLKFVPIRVPFGVNLLAITPRPHGAYARRTFVLNESQASGTSRLVIKSVTDEATAYVNGVKVGNVRGANTPLIADITRGVKPGMNELVVVVRDLLAIMDPAYVNASNPTPINTYLDAPGLFGDRILAMDNVSIESSPPVAATDILVIPSVRRQSLGTRITVLNHTAKPVRAVIKVRVLDAGKPVFEVGTKDVTLEPGKPLDLAFEKDWATPRLWSPQDPHLYVLAVETVNSETGERLDLARERFGFRECWIDGAKIIFNGIPVKLKGLTTPSHVGIRADYQFGRNTSIPDYYDEFGYMCSEFITGVSNTGTRHNVESDVFWETARQNLLIAAKRLQNHPCIIAWDLSNEWLWYLGDSSSDPLLGAKRLMSLTETINRQDPTRWTFYNGDGDLNGLLNNFSFHYMGPFYSPSGYSMNGHTEYYPDGAFWRPLDRYFLPDEKVMSCFTWRPMQIRPLAKPILDTENLWKTGTLMPPGFTRYIGEEDVLSPAVDSGRGQIVWRWKQNLDGHRDVGTSAVLYYGGNTGVDQRAYLLQTFIMPDIVHHGFAGRVITRQYDLLNDLFRPAELTFTWRLVGVDGKILDKGRDVRKMGSADLQAGMLSIRLPNVSQRTVCTLALRLESDGKFVCGEERDIEVWPDKPVPPGNLARKVLLFEPDGSNRTSNIQHRTSNIERGETQGPTAQALTAVGVTFEPVAELASLAACPSPLATLLIIGEEALDSTNAAQTAKLEKFVEGGGCVLILAQTVTPVGLPVTTKLETREWAAQTFVRMGTHPLFKGITDWDLHFWAPDRVVSKGSYTKPDGGAALPLLDSGSDSGLEWVQMMELYCGKGSYLICQLPVVSKWNDEPMAREMLTRLLRYAGGKEGFLSPNGRVKALVAKDSPVERKLNDLGVCYDILKPDDAIEAGSPILLDASLPATEAQRVKWSEALNSGSTLVVCNAQAGDAEWLGKLAGQPVKMTVPPYLMWQGRGYRVGFDRLAAGLSHQDLYWKRFDGAEAAGGQAEDPTLTIEPLQDWSVSAANSRELVFPGALLEISVGKGRLIIDQRRWWTLNEKLLKLSSRNLSALMLGLGVEIAPPVPQRELPKNIAYQTIDLTQFANRSLVDDVAEDGKGGWSDQGPKGDLRTFPTGRQNFQGVPFEIGKEPKCCIVLSSKSRPFPELLPDEVTIPVGYPVAGLCFLHASAYGGNLVALYQIQYNDGTSIDLPLIRFVNIHDWAAPAAFLHEKGTTSRIAWTGSCPMFNTIGIYCMLWVNPKPDIPVKAVRFSNPEKAAVPILLGLTAVVSKADNTQAKANAAKAQEQLREARKMIEAKNDAKAEKLLREAVAADPLLFDAHQALADLCEKKGDENVVLEVCRAWAASGDKNPYPYNRIGQILEKRKDYKGALDAYTKSLEIGWNQPPTIEAKARMEREVSNSK